MTSNQIAYAAHLEKVRSDLANEGLERTKQELTKQELETKKFQAEESARANRANEELTRQSIEANVLNNIRTTDASRYSASMNYASSVYASDVSRENTKLNIQAQAPLREAQVKTETTTQWKNVLTGIGNIVRGAVSFVSALS